MGRIRTIKPEFPQSESIGRLSRDGRLLFVQLWTICDDAGRARGNSRILASLLYPYDDDAKDLILAWLDELERHDLVRRYKAGDDSYLEIRNWLKHQKIDKPSPSKLPPYIEESPKPRESSTTDMDMDPTKDQEGKGYGPTAEGDGSSNPAPRETSNSEAREWLLTLKAKYPPYAMREDWLNAERNARILVETGQATWETLEAGVLRYAAACKSDGRKVMNPKNFFGDDDRPWSQQWAIAPPPPNRRDVGARRVPTEQQRADNDRAALENSARSHGIDPAGLTEPQINDAIYRKQNAEAAA